MRILLAGDNFITPEVLAEAVARYLPEAKLSQLLSGFPEEPFRFVEGVHEATGDVDALIAALDGVEACITHTHPFSRRVFASCPTLRWLAVCRGGPVNVDLEAAKEFGVEVFNVAGRNAIATAEHTVALILAAARQITQCHEEVISGRWGVSQYRFDQAVSELAGAKAGIVGFGAVGSLVARGLAGLGMRVRWYDPYFSGEQPKDYQRLDSLDELLRGSAVLTLHARLTKATQGLIGAREIALLPPGAILVNCARGGLLDTDAFADALDGGHLFAGALDVYPSEPLPAGHRLLNTPRLTLTPHVAGASKQSARFAADTAANWLFRAQGLDRV